MKDFTYAPIYYWARTDDMLLPAGFWFRVQSYYHRLVVTIGGLHRGVRPGVLDFYGDTDYTEGRGG